MQLSDNQVYTPIRVKFIFWEYFWRIFRKRSIWKLFSKKKWTCF